MQNLGRNFGLRTLDIRRVDYQGPARFLPGSWRVPEALPRIFEMYLIITTKLESISMILLLCLHIFNRFGNFLIDAQTFL